MAQNTQLVPILLNVLAAFISAFGQYLYKIGSAKLGVEPIYKNYHIFSGIVLFTVVMVLFLTAFKLGGRLSVTYPIYASTFLWGALIGVYFDKEPWSYGQAFGVFFILVGITLVAALSPE
jgi:multidrug transporter EmrE-like cation transporter